MGELFSNEIKRIFKLKKTLVFILLSLILSLIFAWYCIAGEGSDTLNNDGTVTIIKGKAAVNQKMGYQKAMEGEVTEEKILKGLTIYRDSYDEVKDKFNYSLELFQHNAIIGMINDLVYVNNLDGYFKFDSLKDIPDEIAKGFYQLRSEKQNRMFQRRLHSEKTIKKAKSIDDKIKTPFSFYAGYRVWNTALEYMSMLIGLILLFSIIFTAPMISENYESGADDIIRTTKFGRVHLAVAKLVVSLLYGTMLFLLGISIFLIIINSIIGSGGLQTSMQMMNLSAIAPIAYKGLLNYMIIGGLISTLSTTAMTMYISSKVKKTSDVLTLSILVFLFYKFMTLIIKPKNRILNLLFAIMPFSSSDMVYTLQSANFYNLGGITIWEPYLNMVANLILLIAFSLLAIRSYKKKQC